MVGLFGSCYYGGYMIGNIFFITFSDVYGRKWFVFLGTLIHSLAYLGMVLSRSVYLTYAMLIVSGLCGAPRCSISLLMASEFVSRKFQVFIVTVIQLVDAMIIVGNGVYYWQISKEYTYFHYFGVTLSFFVAFGLYFLPEPPRWLKSRSKD